MVGFCSSAVKVWRGWKLCFCLCSPSLCIFLLKKTRSNFRSSFRPLKRHPKRQLIKSKRLDNGVTLLNHQTTELVDSQREGSRGRNVEVKALLVSFPLLCIYVSFRVSSKAWRSVVMCWWSPSRSWESWGQSLKASSSGHTRGPLLSGRCSASTALPARVGIAPEVICWCLSAFPVWYGKDVGLEQGYIVIYSFVGKCALLSVRREMIVKAVRVKSALR